MLSFNFGAYEYYCGLNLGNEKDNYVLFIILYLKIQ